MKSVAGFTYTYDGDGNRVQKSSGKIYWYGAGTEILDESDASGNFTNEYVFFGGKRVAMRTVSSGTIDYYEEDMLGSARTERGLPGRRRVEPGGSVQAGATTPCFDADFLPFGQEVDFTSTCGSNYKFEGKERDLETGNDDFGARYYRSALGRWLSADWSSVPAPVPYANLTNPQTLNLYAMVSDNPETFADLDGHVCGTVEGSETVGCTTGPLDLWAPGVPSEQPQKTGTGQPPSNAQQAANVQSNQQNRAQHHVVRFEGDQRERKKLKASWHYLITHSEHARAILKTALEKGDVTIRPTENNAYYDSDDRSINVDPNFPGVVQTNDVSNGTRGLEATPTSVILGHELGHAAGAHDDGPNHMNNVIKNENPIRRDLRLPLRTEY